MKTIIACTDFSQCATNAVHYAAALARTAGSKLVLFHHFDYPIPATDLPGMYPALYAGELADDCERRLQELGATLSGEYGIETEPVVRALAFYADLEELFHHEKAGLVVVGTQGRNAVVNTLTGSIASNLIRQGKLPLLLVPKGVAFHPVRKIIFPYDNRVISQPGHMNPLLEIAGLFDAYVEVLTLFDLEKTPELVPEGKVTNAHNHLEHLIKSVRHGYSYENETAIDKGIQYEAVRSEADMIAMIPHHHTLWSTLLNQSATQRVSAGITLPLLVLSERVE